MARMYQIRAVSVDTSTAMPTASANQRLATTKPTTRTLPANRATTGVRRIDGAAGEQPGQDDQRDERQLGPGQAARQGALRLVRLLGGQGHRLDHDQPPEREGDRVEDGPPALAAERIAPRPGPLPGEV